MQKISAFNQNNQALEIEMVRYFKRDEKKYLIFTLGEKDEQGYIKVYVSKILGLNGTLAAYDIIDETEWANVKELVKKIIKANREGEALGIEDLSTERLNNIKINGQQVFKLMSNLIDLLGSNVNAVQDEIEEEIAPIESETTNLKEPTESSEVPSVENNENKEIEEKEITNSVPSSNSEYQILYQELFNKYEKVVAENAGLKTKLENIKAIIEE